VDLERLKRLRAELRTLQEKERHAERLYVFVDTLPKDVQLQVRGKALPSIDFELQGRLVIRKRDLPVRLIPHGGFSGAFRVVSPAPQNTGQGKTFAHVATCAVGCPRCAAIRVGELPPDSQAPPLQAQPEGSVTVYSDFAEGNDSALTGPSRRFVDLMSRGAPW
jgi:hypothetical protein